VNAAQELWWKQAKADLELFEHLRGRPGWRYPCHCLQALQMASEKIAKASFRAGVQLPTKRSHLGLTRLLRRLSTVREADQPLVASVFSAGHFERFEQLLFRVRAIARDVERLPPAIAGPDRVNLEYPWPDRAPTSTPAEWKFDVWKRLEIAEGREFLRFLSRAVDGFPQYAHVFR
jgi:hypothetical protein